MENNKKTTIAAVIPTFILCYFIWILLTGSFAAQELIVGAVVSLLVAWFSARWFVHERPFGFFGKRASLTIVCLKSAVPSSFLWIEKPVL